MKGIQDDLRTVTTSTAMDSDWPLNNVLDDIPQNYAKADQDVQTLVADLLVYDYYGGSNALYIGRTNARTGTLKVYNSAKTILYETFSLDFVGTSFFSFLTQRYIKEKIEVWQEYTYKSAVLNLELTLVTDVLSDITISNGGSGYSAGTLSASGGGISGFFGTYTVDDSGTIDSVSIIDSGTGVTDSSSITITPSDTSGSSAVFVAESTIHLGTARAGFAKEFRNPKFGFNEGFKDYSIVKKYSNGSEYYKQRGVARTFSGSLLIDLAEIDNYTNLLVQSRLKPIAWNLLNNEQRGIVFGKSTTLPSSSRNNVRYMESNLMIEEIL